MTDKEIFKHRFHKANVRKSTKQLAKELKIPLRDYEAALIKVKAGKKLEINNTISELKAQVELLEKQKESLKYMIKQNEKRIAQLVTTVNTLQNEKKNKFTSLKSKMQSVVSSAIDKTFQEGFK